MTTEAASPIVEPVMTIIREFAESAGRPIPNIAFNDLTFKGITIDNLPTDHRARAVVQAGLYDADGTYSRVFVAQAPTGAMIYALDPHARPTMSATWDPTLAFTDLASFTQAVAKRDAA